MMACIKYSIIQYGIFNSCVWILRKCWRFKFKWKRFTDLLHTDNKLHSDSVIINCRNIFSGILKKKKNQSKSSRNMRSFTLEFFVWLVFFLVLFNRTRYFPFNRFRFYYYDFEKMFFGGCENKSWICLVCF